MHYDFFYVVYDSTISKCSSPLRSKITWSFSKKVPIKAVRSGRSADLICVTRSHRCLPRGGTAFITSSFVSLREKVYVARC